MPSIAATTDGPLPRWRQIPLPKVERRILASTAFASTRKTVVISPMMGCLGGGPKTRTCWRGPSALGNLRGGRTGPLMLGSGRGRVVSLWQHFGGGDACSRPQGWWSGCLACCPPAGALASGHGGFLYAGFWVDVLRSGRRVWVAMRQRLGYDCQGVLGGAVDCVGGPDPTGSG